MALMADAAPIHMGLEALADGFCMVDGEWRVSYWNATAERLLGLRRGAVVGRSLWAALPPLEASPFGEHLRLVMESRAALRSLVPHLPGCCAGTYAVYAAPLADGGLATQFRDATDETQLAERYPRLLESIRDGFVALDPDGSIVYINHVAERMLRLPRRHALGTQVWSLIPREPAAIEQALRGTLQDGAPRRLSRVQPEGELFRGRYFDVWIHPLTGGGISILFQDVSAPVTREQDLERLAAEARQASRAKSRFFAAVSHELRTPLNAIIGYTHLLSTATYGELPEAALRAAARASICAEHLARIVDDLLLMTTAEVDQLPVVPTTVALDEFLASAVEPLRQQAVAKGLSFTVSVASGTPPLHTDPDRLRQVLHALLSNAVKFTGRGEIRVEVSPLAAQEHEGAEPAGVRIRVLDTGSGIPAAERERVFEAFEQLGDPARTDSLQRGPGLGLTIARQVTQLLQGTLEIEDRGSDSGTVFRLELPLRSAPRPA